MNKMDWAVSRIIQGAGINLNDADEHIIRLAEQCKERCYYIDAASRELKRVLGYYNER